jgi:hypothetical protein
VFLPDAIAIGRRTAEVKPSSIPGLTVEDSGLPDNLILIHALDLHGCPLVMPKQAPADLWHDLTAFEACVRAAAARRAAPSPTRD